LTVLKKKIRAKSLDRDQRNNKFSLLSKNRMGEQIMSKRVSIKGTGVSP